MICSRRILVFLVLFLSPIAQAWAAELYVVNGVGYAQGIAVDEALKDCSWTSEIAPVVASKAKVRKPKLASGTEAGLRLTIQLSALRLPTQDRHKLAVRLRADVVNESGKLIASRDFDDQVGASSLKDVCPAFSKLAKSVGADIADWFDEVYLPECTGTCPGIHPDQPIVVQRAMLVSDPDAMNEQVTTECKWTGYMPGLIIDAYNDSDDAVPGRVVLSKEEGAVTTGRRLVLTVDNIHVIGGGGFTGPKWIAMHGELYDGEMKLASFEITKLGGDGYSFRACSILRSKSESVADNVADWLRHPEMNKKL